MSAPAETVPTPAPAPGRTPRGRWIFLGVTLAVALLDLGTKAWAFSALGGRIVEVWELRDGSVTDRPRPDGDPEVVRHVPIVHAEREATVIPGCFHIHLSLNTGAVFGILQGRTLQVMALTLVALAMIAWMVFSADPRRTWLHVAMGCVCGGALGNLWDRACYGAVRDFIHWFIGSHVWPTFNIADAALVVGIALILLLEWRTPKPAAAGAPARG